MVSPPLVDRRCLDWGSQGKRFGGLLSGWPTLRHCARREAEQFRIVRKFGRCERGPYRLLCTPVLARFAFLVADLRSRGLKECAQPRRADTAGAGEKAQVAVANQLMVACLVFVRCHCRRRTRLLPAVSFPPIFFQENSRRRGPLRHFLRGGETIRSVNFGSIVA